MKIKRQRNCGPVAVALAVATMVSAAATATEQIVSLDFCADQYVLGFADAAAILAVSPDAAGPLSFYRDRAIGLPTTRGSAEEILMLEPTLVVQTYRGSPGLDRFLKRLGIEIFHPPYAFDFNGHLENLALAGKAFDAREEAERQASDLQIRYDALRASPAIDASAVYLTPSGITAGEGSAVADIIALAGLRSFATEIGIQGWAPLPLEQVVMSAPDLAITSFFEEGTVSVSAWSSSRHGVFKGLMDDLPTIQVPSRLMSCSVAQAVDAAEFVRAKAIELGFEETQPSEQPYGGKQ